MSSTFGTITTVRLGIYAAQKGLDVTGNNITNINTNGYTRQRLDQISLVTSASDKYGSQYKARVGQGPVLTGISQLRDPGMDISYRKANSDVGSADQMLAGLEDLAGILDEVGKGDGEQDDGVILNQLNDLRDLINQALTNGIEDYEGSIRASANALCTQFHQYAKALEGLMEDYETQLNEDTTRVNQILTELRDVNLQIRNSDVRGDAALELRDKRNLLLDELSGYMKIDVTYSMVDAGGGYEVEEMSVKLADRAANDPVYLVKGEYAAQLSVKDAAGNFVDNYDITVSALTNKDGDKHPDRIQDDSILLGDNDLYGSLQSLRELLTEEGEYASTAASLQKFLDGAETTLRDDVDTVNKLLQNIQTYTNGIKSGTGDATALKAQRDAAVKQLQEYLDVKVTTAGDDITIALNGTGNQTLFDSATGNIQTLAFTGDYTTSTDYNFTLNGAPLADGALTGALNTLRDQMNEASHDLANNTSDTQVDASAASKRGIPYYIKQLDSLAQTFAEEMNKLNTVTPGTNIDGAGDLFETNDGSGAITAGNITISQEWAEGTVKMLSTRDPNAPTDDRSNLAEFLNLFNSKDIEFDPKDIVGDAQGATYEGSFESMLLRIQSTLAQDQMAATTTVSNYAITLNNVYTDRDSITGVDLNDEATSLMVYQKAYTAACRVLTTLEEAIDTLLNATA